MAPNKKKKKAAANPARGFATASIASKPKQDKENAIEPDGKPEPLEKETAASPVPAVEPDRAVGAQAQTTPTPEELEAQLERDELQLLVEKHASKTKRDARRHVTKLQTDRRVLRSQSETMTVHDWISNDILADVVALAQAESNDSNRRQGQQSLLRLLSEEDAMAKLWTLDLTLRDMGFSRDHVQPVLQWLCANAARVDATGSIWGLQESLEWLALNKYEDHPFSYNESKANSSMAAVHAPSQPGKHRQQSKEPDGETSSPSVSNIPSQTMLEPIESTQNDVAVSDLDSDLELGEMVPTYLKVKSRLFEIDPELVDSKSARKQPKGSKGRNTKPALSTQSSTARKLLSQLQQLESDALFDEREAEAQWPAKRNEIAQRKAAERREQSSNTIASRQTPTECDDTVTQTAEKATDATGDISDPLVADDEDILGDMFSAIPDEPSAKEPSKDCMSSQSVQLKDFGKQSGLAPRKILEEVIRSRDSNARLAYKLISPTTYSCRHSLIITWSKIPDVEYDFDIEGVLCETNQMQVIYRAVDIATVSVEQSENYISTAALFSISAASAKEEKAYLRLHSNWRDLYRNFLEHRGSRIDANDRGTVKYYRSLIQEQVENEESDGIVLTSRFKMRNQGYGASNSSPSNSGQNTPPRIQENLMELWRQKSSTMAYEHMLVMRKTLPVFSFRDSILSTIDANQVTIVCGETGCGKSTQIPSFVLEHELSQGKPCKVFCTEPRRISAISLAQRVSNELGETSNDLGTLRSLVGYAIRLESKTSAQTKLVYATVGVVLRMLESSLGLDEVTHLIIDEVHERSIDTDFLLIILRSLMERRPELKVILMSATVDAQRFSMYLNNAPVLQVPGRTFPVETRFLEDAIEMTEYMATSEAQTNNFGDSGDEEEPVKEKSGIPSKLPGYSATTRKALSNYDEYALDYELIARLIETVAHSPELIEYSAAMLVFLPGIAEIRQLNDMLVVHPSLESKDWLIYPLHSTISSDEQQAAFQVPPPGVRKIVLATNIAETGVTIPDITCVIDTGKHKEMRFDERRQLSRLTQSFISRANAKQRRGRAGRVQKGLCFHLFTRHRHDNMMTEQQTPEMLRLSLQDLVMRTKICKLGDIEKTLSEALDPPSARNIRRAIDALIEVDALTPTEDLTPLGRQIAKLPLDAHLGKLVLLASLFGCVDVAITIAAILSSKSPFLTPFSAKQRADAARFAFKKGDSDLLTTYNAYRSWKLVCTTAGRSEVQFCQKNFLSQQNLGNIEDLKAQLLSSLADAGFVKLSSEDRRALGRYRSTSRHRMFVSVPADYDKHSQNDGLVNSVIATAFYPKILTREGKGWRNISNNQTVSLAPTSVNKPTSINTSSAKYLSYYHIMQSSNKFYNAHSTSIVHPLPMVLMVGADMDFKLHAGVISLPGNVLRFAVRDWQAAVALKVLRRRTKEILSNMWKNPGRQVSEREQEWLDLFERIFVERFEKDEKIRERAAGKGK